MNIKRGFIKLTIEGKELPCKFGMNAFHLFTTLRDIKAGEISDIMQMQGDLSVMRDLLFCGIEAGCASKEMENPLNLFEVGDFIDIATPEQIKEILEAVKNSQVLGKSMNAAPNEEKKKE